jgi:hypothetical protein
MSCHRRRILLPHQEAKTIVAVLAVATEAVVAVAVRRLLLQRPN